jgi:O-antigen/teichoic acid export membrane protein
VARCERGLRLGLALRCDRGVERRAFKGDVAFLKALNLPTNELSQYAACTRLTEAVLLLFAPVTNVLLHSLRQRAGDRVAFSALLQRALTAAVALGLLACLGSWAASERLMPALFGPEFHPAGTLLPWVALSLPFGLSNLVCFQALIARDREHRLVLALVLAATALALGLTLGAAASGARGAALGVAIAQALLLGACLLGLRHGKSEA